MPTIKDVAREAGVSVATVSRVFNGSCRVSQGAALAVIAAAAELDYSPNGAARSLSTKRTHVLAVLLPDLHGEFFSEIIRGIDHGTRAERYQVILSSSHASASEMISVARSLRGRIDGLIVMAPDAGSARAIGDIARYFPVVLLNPGLRVPVCSAVSIANAHGATAVVRHLAGLGHRRIAVVSGPTENVDARERLKGCRRALREAGCETSERLEIRGDFHELSGYRSAEAILALRPRPTAVFAANDYMAIGLLRALAEAGVRVPEDIAVAGFDDIPLAQYLAPPLTTVRVDSYKLGERAVRLWFENKRTAEGGDGHRHEVLPTELVVRSSCGARARLANGKREGGDAACEGRGKEAGSD